jgi:hypothetical protein
VFSFTSVRTNVLSQSATFFICSVGGGRKLLLNTVSFVSVDFVYVFDLSYVFLNVCWLAYISISTFLHCNLKRKAFKFRLFAPGTELSPRRLFKSLRL